MILGLQRGRVGLVPHQDGWGRAFAEEKSRLESVLGGSALGIEHVGSTAVPGLAAKPVIDIAVSVRSLADIEAWPLLLRDHGYASFGDREGRREHFFAKGPEEKRIVYLHVVAAESSRWNDYLKFRDALRTHTALRLEYERLKIAACERHRTDRGAYTTAKDEFIRRVLSEP